ncbi:MAG TPA: hypothetical protein VFE47_09075 [Tepidisphaeraceae bacterium]|jgi:hypothetical protein|nr:hypothetical protein [Tepidisphaeraceae bacterium]
MTIKAILRNGLIEPIEPLPAGWADGQELVVEDPTLEVNDVKLDEWARDLQTGAEHVGEEEHDRFRQALVDIERESKETVRREWGLP